MATEEQINKFPKAWMADKATGKLDLETGRLMRVGFDRMLNALMVK